MTVPSSGSTRITAEDEGVRLDTVVARLSGISRSRVQKLIGDGMVLVDGTPAKKNHQVTAGESLTWELPAPEPERLAAQNIPLDVVYEDEHIVVVNKPADMVMYPGPGHGSETLVNALLARYPDITGVGGRGRPGVFHRLDRGTSGLVAVARTGEAFDAMVEMMKERRVAREYLALVVGGVPADSGTIDAPMGRSRTNRRRMSVDRAAGRRAVSRFEVKQRFGDEFTLVQVSLETGRTHQIRVHFKHIGHPVVGDPEYSRGRASRRLGLERQFLHAFRLSFEHPVTGEPLDLRCDLPADLQSALSALAGR
jgi:23S rRNA pseudouridine1911/1915/1917 synthase